MNGLAPSRLTRWIIGLVIGILFAIPLLSTLLFTLRDRESGGYSLANWIRVFDPNNTQVLTPIWTGLGNSLILAVVTVAIVLLLLLPTMILIELRFPRLGRVEDIASTIAFLCSDGGSFINGQTIVVDGGWTSTKYLSDFALNSDWVAR